LRVPTSCFGKTRPASATRPDFGKFTAADVQAGRRGLRLDRWTELAGRRDMDGLQSSIAILRSAVETG
jgi:hypothetical protein